MSSGIVRPKRLAIQLFSCGVGASMSTQTGATPVSASALAISS